MAGPRIDLVTLFPELLEHFLEGSLLGAARRAGLLRVEVTALRDFATGLFTNLWRYGPTG